MQRDLDTLMTSLAHERTDRRLAALEPAVWAHISDESRQPGTALRWQAGIAGLALGLGTVVGGAATATPPEPLTLFAPAVALAPSTLLAAR